MTDSGKGDESPLFRYVFNLVRFTSEQDSEVTSCSPYAYQIYHLKTSPMLVYGFGTGRLLRRIQ